MLMPLPSRGAWIENKGSCGALRKISKAAPLPGSVDRKTWEEVPESEIPGAAPLPGSVDRKPAMVGLPWSAHAGRSPPGERG